MNSLSDEQIAKLNDQFSKSAYSEDPSRGFKLTSIDGYHIIERLNDVFGLCGSGWGLDILEHIVNDKEVLVLAELWYIIDDNTTGVIKCEGGHKIVKDNLTDAYKSARTNAICKGSSFLGVGLDVYKGEFNGIHEKKKPPPLKKDVSPPVESGHINEPPSEDKALILDKISKLLGDHFKGNRKEAVKILKNIFDEESFEKIKERGKIELEMGYKTMQDQLPEPISTDGEIKKPKSEYYEKLNEVGEIKQTFIDLDKLEDYRDILMDKFKVDKSNKIKTVKELSQLKHFLNKKLQEYEGK